MDAVQYNTIIDGLRALKAGQQKLEARIEHLETGQQQIRNDLRKEIQGMTRWVMGLFVAALLVNGPVIGAIVSLVILKLNLV